MSTVDNRGTSVGVVRETLFYDAGKVFKSEGEIGGKITSLFQASCNYSEGTTYLHGREIILFFL